MLFCMNPTTPLTGIVFIAGVLITAVSVLLLPRFGIRLRGRMLTVETFWIGVTLCALLCVVTGLLPLSEALAAIRGNHRLSPAGIMILFFSMAFISIFLDHCGFFDYCARLAIRHAGTSGTRLFFSLYATVSLLTVFTSNDIVILTFTPFIYYFARDTKIDPVPYLVAEFFAANTWSMALLIGNPTNILLSGAFGIGFFEYLRVMLLPAVGAGVVNALVLCLLFRKRLRHPLVRPETDPSSAIRDRFGAAAGLVILILCILSLSIAQVLHQEMWRISLFFAVLLFLFIVSRLLFNTVRCRRLGIPYDNPVLKQTAKKIPWAILPFAFSLFILVEMVEKSGISGRLAQLLLSASPGGKPEIVLLFGVVSTLAANVLNNIPMSVFFVPLLEAIPEPLLKPAVYAVITGSNLGANITPLGALAGIMWLAILKDHGFPLSFARFMRYGVPVTAASLAAALLLLSLTAPG